MYNGDTKEFEFEEKQEESVNEIIEIRNGEEIETLEDEIVSNMTYEESEVEKTPKKKKKNIFKIIKDKWKDLSKKQKIVTTIIAAVVILAIVITLILVLLNNKKAEKPKEKPVVLEADNYRYENGKLFFLDSDEKEIGSYECQNKKETLCYVAYSSNEDKFDVTKNVYEDETEVNKRMSIINDDYVFIYDNESADEDNIILHSIKENADYESYKLVKEYNLEENYIVVKNEDNKYGVLLFSESGYEEVIGFNYDYLGIITENKEDSKYLVGLKNSKWYLIDYSEKEKSKGTNSEIKNYNDSLIAVLEDNEYSLIDYKNNLITDETYDFITFSGEYILLIKDEELFITDKELNKLYEEGIKLPNKYYNKVNVFNKETNKLVENLYAFGVSINNNTIELTINNEAEEEVKLINVLDSVVSASYENINYFDGKLYIYSDSLKTNLLGYYECSNKNNITSKDSRLDNCYLANNSEFSNNDTNVASDAIGLLPIFNNRFVFIKDNPELNNADNMNIVLYDLTANKKLGTYRAIDAGTYNGKNTITFVEDTGILLIAKNTKNYYGILKVNLNEVGSLDNVKFNDKNKNIEVLKDNFIVEKSDSKYSMIDKTGKIIASNIDGKIMGYNSTYVKAKSNDNYSVYNLTGEKVSTNTYKYVELYDTFFAGVDSSNKLNLYTYDDASKKIFDSSIELKITSNYHEGKSFSATIEGGKYKVVVYNENGESTVFFPTESLNENIIETESENELGE